jgi:hypothetical protein
MPYQSNTSEVVKKNPNEWVSKDEPMTRAQASYLKALCDKHEEKFYESLSKAQASAQIDALRQRQAQSVTKA